MCNYSQGEFSRAHVRFVIISLTMFYDLNRTQDDILSGGTCVIFHELLGFTCSSTWESLSLHAGVLLTCGLLRLGILGQEKYSKKKYIDGLVNDKLSEEIFRASTYRHTAIKHERRNSLVIFFIYKKKVNLPVM